MSKSDERPNPDRSGIYGPIAPLGPTTPEELERLKEAAKFWQRPDIQRILRGEPPEGEDDEGEGVTHDGGSGDVAGDTPE